GWQTWNPNGGAANTWKRDVVSGYSGPGAAFFNNYNINQAGMLDELITPALDPADASDVTLDFKVAYAPPDAIDVSEWDGLEVYVSGDGGKNYHLVYKKTGAQLGTVSVNTNPFSAFDPSQWRDENIDLSSYVTAGQKMIVKFRNTNAFGNNLYIDDINITAACVGCTRDVQVVSINQPRSAECSTDITPTATVKNRGVGIITGFSIAYSIDNGALQTTTVTGVSLAKNDTIQVSLNAATGLNPGQHDLVVYTFNPISSSGTGDQVTSNDTLSKVFGVAGTVAAPLVEGFESSTFPPAGWVVVNSDAGITWARANTGNNSTASAFVNNFNYALTGRIDELYSPLVTYSAVDSVTLSFDVAAAAITDLLPTDTLEVLVTKDCGNTFTSVYKKSGNDLRTVNEPVGTDFTPTSSSQWRTETVDLSTIAPTGPTQIVFRNTNNNKNNIYIDNVNLKTRILPGRLKREGVIVLPNPFSDKFTVWHYQTPTTLKFISVFNSLGQLVWSKEYNSDAQKQEVVDLSSRSAGVYIVRLGYTDSNYNTSIKVVKH
ncbi:MAG TPA: choice-of-anchor J domain-containing protein, partial [Acidobacteriota bacterium]